MVAAGISEADNPVAAVICPWLLKVIPETVAPVILLAIDKAPAPVIANPAPTETPPTAEVVAIGISLAASATTSVIKPYAL